MKQSIRFTLGVSFVALFFWCTWAFRHSLGISTAESSSSPGLVVDRDTIDLGVIAPEDGSVIAEFPITNSTTAAVSLTPNRKSCSCLLEVEAPKHVDTGARVVIKGILDVRRKVGRIHAVIGLATNVPGQEQLDFTIVADVIAPIVVEPSILTFDDPIHGKPQALDIAVTTRLRKGGVARPPEVDLERSLFAIEYLGSETRGDPQSEFQRAIHRFRILPLPSTKQQSPRPQSVRAAVRHGEDAAELTVHVNHRHHPILSGPTIVRLSKSSQPSLTIRLWSRDQRAFHFLPLENRISGINVTVPENTDGIIREVLVSIDPAIPHLEVGTRLSVSIPTSLQDVPPYDLDIVIDQ